jgi:DNA-binding response OmpR family regulator
MVCPHEPARRWILLVEDDLEIRLAVREILEAEGYRVVDAPHGRDGLARLEGASVPCLILLDLMMPVMSGADFLQLLRRGDLACRIPVVILSAWPAEAAKVAALSQGYLAKPLSVDRLLDVVEMHCGPPELAPSPTD